MATVTLTSFFANLNGWQGNLLDAGGGDASVLRTATSFRITLGASSQFAGYVITVAGTGFSYVNNVATRGTMSGLVIADASGNTVLTVAGLAAGTMASDLSLFQANVFGWDTPNWHQGSQQLNAWSMLLSGNDTFNGTTGNDGRSLPGLNAGNDTFNMLDSDDWVNGGAGNDTINGGNGWDTLSFELTTYNEGASAIQGVSINLATGTVIDAWGYTDQISGFENFRGSVFNDVFVGSANEDHFSGMRGKDTIDGGSGGKDWARYDNDAWFGGLLGIVVDLQVSVVGGKITGSIVDGFGNVDTTLNIESVAGTANGDIFIGSSAQNNFAGGEGKDSYNGGAGADHVFFHWRFTNQAQAGVVVDLTRAGGQIRNDGYGNIENAISIENIVGSEQADRIKGSAGQNWLTGHDGKDTLTGAGGADFFQFDRLNEFGDGDRITDFHEGAGVDQDVLQIFVSNWGASNTLHLVNGTAATGAFSTFIYNAANDTLFWDADGTGAQAKIAVCALTNVASLSAANFDLV